MIVRTTVDFTKGLTPEQMKMLDEAAKRPPVYDPENPPQTEEELKLFRRVGQQAGAVVE